MILIDQEAFLVAKTDFISSDTLDTTNWETYSKHDYTTYDPVHTWVEFINRLVRYKKPSYPKAKPKIQEKFQISTPKNLKKVSETKATSNLFDNKLIVGDVVNHQRAAAWEHIVLAYEPGYVLLRVASH